MLATPVASMRSSACDPGAAMSRWSILLLSLLALLPAVGRAAEVQSINGALAPPFLVWSPDKAGWTFTASRTYLLDGIYSTFRNVGAASQTGPILRRDVTVSVQENDAKGNLLARGVFSADASAGTLGANVTPVLLLAGKRYFLSYSGLANLGLNIVDWNINAPAPQQPAGTINLDGWYTGENYQTYYPQVINGVLQVFSAPILRLQGTPVSFGTAADCLFNWAEANYASLFAPAGQASAAYQTYYYRYYPGTRAYVGVSAADNQVYYLAPNGTMSAVGALSTWLALAGCPAS